MTRLWLLGLLSACVPAAPKAGRLPETSEVPSAPTTAVDTTASSVARVRELPLLAPLDVEVVPRMELLRVALRQVDEEASPQVLVERSRILVALGLAPADFEMRAALSELLAETLVGLYDPASGRVLVTDDTSQRDARAGRVHELAHALIDQHFDLHGHFPPGPDDADRAAARAALAEGDANSVMFDFLSGGNPLVRAEVVRRFLSGVQVSHASAPVLGRLLAAPYVDGFRFVERLRREGGWERVNEAWRAPPTTSEQVLHPEAYANREEPRALAHPPLPKPGCREAYSDVLGEQALRCFVTEWVGEAAAADAATGWAGDRVTTFDCPEGYWVNLRLVADRPGLLAGLVEAFAEGAAPARCLEGRWSLGPDETAVELVYPPGAACAEARPLEP